MEVRAVAKYIRVQPRKVRIVAATVKGQAAVMSAHKLQYHPAKGAKLLRKVLVSAIANAVENHQLQPENLRICQINIDEGPRMKRITQRAQGRANRIIKKTSHITVVLEDYEPAADVKPHGSKAKPRPKFEAPKKSAPKKAEAVQETAVEEKTPQVEETVVEAVEETTAEAPAVEAPTTEVAAEETAGAEAPAEEEKKD